MVQVNRPFFPFRYIKVSPLTPDPAYKKLAEMNRYGLDLGRLGQQIKHILFCKIREISEALTFLPIIIYNI
jgi:hypothetical protein